MERAAGGQRGTAVAPRPAVAPRVTASASASYQILLNGKNVGNAKSIGGCATYADVLTTDGASDLGAALIDPCVIKHGRMNKSFESWLAAEIQNKNSKGTEITVVALNQLLKPVAALLISNARLIGFDVPAVDAASKEAAYFTSTITGDSILPTTLPASAGTIGKSKTMLASNFMFRVGEDVQTSASKVSAISLSRDFSEEKPGPWTVSDLQVTTSFSAQPRTFPKWYADTVLSIPPTTDEQSAALILLAADLTTHVFEIDLGNVGLYRADAGLGGNRTWRMYAELGGVTFP